jgi:hypothetical protein
MVNFFPGAGSLFQDAVGVSNCIALTLMFDADVSQHGVRVTDSDCTSDHTIKYLETGELPPSNLRCEPNGEVFDAPLDSRKVRRSLHEMSM